MFKELFEEAGLSLDRLQTLCEVAENGSIGEATRGDTNRQTQFSRQIGELEKFFGIDILNRDSRPYRLSEDGRVLAKISRDYLQSLSDFKAQCGSRPVKLVIGAGESIIQWLLMPMLDEWSKKLPAAAISMRNLRTQQIIKDVTDGEIDLGLVRRSAIAKPLKSVGKWEYRYRLFVPRRLRAKLSGKLKISQIASLPIALIGGEGQFRQQLSTLANNEEASLNIRLECSSYSQIASAVQGGGYCGFLPHFAAKFFTTNVDSYDVAGLESLKRELAFVWNPKKAALRPVLLQAVKLFK